MSNLDNVSRQLVWAAIVVGSVATLSACGAARNPVSRSCVGDECTSNANPTSFCTRDTDCSADQYCSGGTCQPRTGAQPGGNCTIHNDCPVGDYCNIVTSRCVECLNDDHCDVGLVCRGDGTCGTDIGCSTDADCGGLVCNTGTGDCVQCVTSGECPTGQTCRNNSCFTNGGADPTCQAQADCDTYGRICDLATHTCRACANDPECGVGKICAAGTCTPESGGSSGGDGSCTARDECGGMACFLGMCMPCIADFMCVDLSDLFTGATMICDPSSGACVAPECATAYDCAAGEACYDGHCGECLYDEECRSGETCDSDTGVCGTVSTSTGCGTECADLLYTACTCGAADPCDWRADGYCDDYCATTFPNDHFDDTNDCGGGGGAGPVCDGACDDLYYTACTCSAADPCGWQADGYCDDTCATEFPSDYFDDSVDC